MQLRVLIILLMLSATCFAQQKQAADSLYVYRQDQQLAEVYIQSAAQLISAPVTEASNAFINYGINKGHFRTAQQAESTRAFNFGTTGISTLGRFKTAGYFNFQRTWQDSLAWTAQGVPNDAEPYYFAAGKAGRYQRINYNMGGIITYTLVNKKLYLASGLDYFYNTASRSVDPRPSVQTFYLLTRPEIVYQLGQHYLSIGGLWGYNHENNSIGYKSTQYASGTQYPDRINYLMMGYGYYTPYMPSGSKSILRHTNLYGLNLNYAFTNATAYLRARIGTEQSTENNYFPSASTENDKLFGTFTLNSYKFNIVAGASTTAGRHQLVLKGNYDNGKDKNVDLGGSNYSYQAQEISLAYDFETRSGGNKNSDWGIIIDYHHQYRKDISTAHLLDVNYLQPGIRAALYQKFGNSNRLNLSISPAILIPFNSSLQVPASQINLFTINIAYPEYSYLTAKALNLNAVAEYITPRLFKNLQSSLKLEADYLKPINTVNGFLGSAFTPSGDFLKLNISFNIYF